MSDVKCVIHRCPDGLLDTAIIDDLSHPVGRDCTRADLRDRLDFTGSRPGHRTHFAHQAARLERFRSFQDSLRAHTSVSFGAENPPLVAPNDSRVPLLHIDQPAEIQQ